MIRIPTIYLPTVSLPTIINGFCQRFCTNDFQQTHEFLATIYWPTIFVVYQPTFFYQWLFWIFDQWFVNQRFCGNDSIPMICTNDPHQRHHANDLYQWFVPTILTNDLYQRFLPTISTNDFPPKMDFWAPVTIFSVVGRNSKKSLVRR